MTGPDAAPASAGQPSAHAAAGLPSFRVWQARQLLGRDMLCGCFIFFTYMAFLYKTVPQLCSTGPATAPNPDALAGNSLDSNSPLCSNLCNTYADISSAAEAADACPAGCYGAAAATASPSSSSSHAAAWPASWQLVCGQLTSSSATVSSQAGLTVLPAVFKPLVKAAESCVSGPASSSSGMLGFVGAAVQWLQCRVSWTALVVATRLLRVVLYIAQGLAIFFFLGFLDSDILHIAATPLLLCLCVLLLVPFPCINFAALWKVLCLPGSGRNSSSDVAAASSSRHAEGADSCDCCSTSSKASTASRVTTASACSTSSSANSLVLPYNPHAYWQRPRLRLVVVVLQRLLPACVACLQLGGVGPRQKVLESMYFSQMGWGYMYVGWTGWMLVAVPVRLQVVISTLEWFLTIIITAKLEAVAAGNTSSSPIESLPGLAYQGLVSCLFVLVLPSLGVLWLEKSQRARFDMLIEQHEERRRRPKQQRRQRHVGSSSSSMAVVQGLAPSAAATTPTIGTPTSNCNSSFSRASTICSSSMRLSSDSDISMKSAAAAAAAACAFNTSSSSGVQLLRDIAASLQLAADASAAAGTPQSTGCAPPQALSIGACSNHTTPAIPSAASSATAAAAPAEDSSSLSGSAVAAALGPLESLMDSAAAASGLLPDILPGLRGLLGDREAAAVFTAAAHQAAAQQAGSRRPRSYRSMAATLPVSIEVHSAPHSTLPSLGPLLDQALQQQLQHTAAAGIAGPSSAAISPVYTHSACFAGCVQLIANVFVLGDRAAALDRSDCSSGNDHEDGSSSSSSSIKHIRNNAGGDDGAGMQALLDQRAAVASDLLARVRGAMDPAAAVEDQGDGGFTALEGQEVVPQHIDVVVGGSCASTLNSHAAVTPGPVSGSNNSTAAKPAAAAATAASLLHCQPCCLVADVPRQLQLTVDFMLNMADTGSGNSCSVEVPCRLLAVQQGRVVVDEDVAVAVQRERGHNRASISVSVPGMAPGLMHVALLPGSKPPAQTPAVSFSSANTPTQQQQLAQGSVVMCRAQPAAPAPAPASAALLLLQPLLVLPGPAAAELQAFGLAAADDAAAAAGYVDTRAAGSNSASAAAWATVSALTVDMAYLLSAAENITSSNKAAAAAAGSSQQATDTAGLLPAGVATVLSHMCQHLAAWQCWQLMHFLVNTLQAAAGAAAAAAPAAVTTSDRAESAQQQCVEAAGKEGVPLDISAAPTGSSSSSASRDGVAEGRDTRTASEAATAAATMPAAAAGVEFEPETKPSPNASSSVGQYDGSGSSGAGSAKQLPAAAAAGGTATHELAAAAADEAARLSRSSKLQAALSQLVFGFCGKPLELAYLDYITMQTYAVDAFGGGVCVGGRSERQRAHGRAARALCSGGSSRACGALRLQLVAQRCVLAGGVGGCEPRGKLPAAGGAKLCAAAEQAQAGEVREQA
ncbi:hypothetical protein COO60DRAFT_342100 [Scenedesmus sp. NREL 46B-D3]|nr:hypothetical protein COO60DRAFT_342100 [Scenedesmus sp. NREL 46B-D3]